MGEPPLAYAGFDIVGPWALAASWVPAFDETIDLVSDAVSYVARTEGTPMRRSIVLLTHVALVSALTSCGSGDEVGIPNPAAVYCEEQGGAVSGAEPMCSLPSGETVDAWEYYRATHPDPGDS